MKNENENNDKVSACHLWVQNVQGDPAPFIALHLMMLNKYAMPPLQFILKETPQGLEIHGVITETDLLKLAECAPSNQAKAPQATAQPAPETNRMPAFGNN